MQNKKKLTIIITCVVIAVILVGAAVWFFFFRDNINSSSSGDAAYVQSVAELTGGAVSGAQNKYSGIVEPQATLDIQKNDEKKIKQIYVEQGDMVSVGDALFSYDTEDDEMAIQQGYIELEELDNEIASWYTRIDQLQKEKNAASSDQQLEYSTEIQSAQNSLKRAEYNRKSKEVEMDQLRKSIDASIVHSEMEGVVKSINESSTIDYYGEWQAFMTIMSVGEYRIMGKVSEMSVWSLEVGSPVIIRSRIDQSLYWNGEITEVDLENPVSNDNGYYISSSSGEQTTKYPFYVSIEGTSDLILGQHVYIELDGGQENRDNGLWLYSGYFVLEGNDSYVWAQNSKNKLEKRKVTLGDYDEMMDQYEVIEGLGQDDFIAWPSELLSEGLPCTTDESALMNYMDMGGDDNLGDGINYDDLGDDFNYDDLGEGIIYDEDGNPINMENFVDPDLDGIDGNNNDAGDNTGNGDQGNSISVDEISASSGGAAL